MVPFEPGAAARSPGVAEAIRSAATRMPESIAVEAGNARLSYAALERRATALAARLREAGVSPGDLVAVCLPRALDEIVALRAAWAAGAAYLPLDPAWPQARIAELVARAGCAALIAAAPLGEAIRGDVPWLVPDDAEADPAGQMTPEAEALAYVIFTSGSTGTPKAVEVTHANLAALNAWHRHAFQVGEGTRTSHLAGLGFDAAAWEIWPTLAAGGTLCLAPDTVRLDPAALRDWLLAERVAVAFAPTALAEPMLALDWPAEASLRLLLTGADRLTARPRARLPFAFVNNYGPTESTVVATSGIVRPEGDGLPTIGAPIAGTHIHILDEGGHPAPEGEIWIGGAQVARGYRGDPALTAERFIDHAEHGRLYRTGDRGAWLPDGEIAFKGRVDQQVKVRGHRIEPAEIVAALNGCEGVAASAVLVRDGELVAYIVPDATEPSAAALAHALAERLPDYMVPARFARLAALPLTANGKLDAAALPDPAASPLAAAPKRKPATPTEQRLLGIVSEVIGRSDIGTDEDFFLLGGHSLLGTQVVVRARDAFGVELTLFHLFEGRTVESLGRIVEGLILEKLDSLSDEDIRRMAG